MWSNWILPSIIGLWLLWLLIRERRRQTFKASAVWWLLVIQLGDVAWQSFALFQETGTKMKYLLPPYTDFYYRQVINLLHPLIAGWGAALVILLGLALVRRKQRHGYFDEKESLFLAAGAAAVGWPSVFIFLAMIFVLGILGMIIDVVRRKKTASDRLVISPYIIPAAILTLFTQAYLLPLTRLEAIRF